jgi:beta-galactosidase GanA
VRNRTVGKRWRVAPFPLPRSGGEVTMRTVQLSRRRLMIDGKPSLMLSGEVHYFRLDRADWASRLDALVAAACDAVATYMPWLVHELPDGSIDLEGRSWLLREGCR